MTTDVDLAPRGSTTDDSESGSDPEGRTGADEQTDLTLEGLAPADVTAQFLTDVMDAADARGLAVEGVSVNRRDE